ncbi:family 20 glycosylhydrolase [Prolixibacteraceae bacterium]|nr:family 20 glycosylhydrolase [Prolixibacteraceae bacterium]
MKSVLHRRLLSYLCIITSLCLISCNNASNDSSNVIPNPSSYNKLEGTYNLSNNISIQSNSALLRGEEKYLTSMWISEFKGTVTQSKTNPTIQLVLLRDSKDFKKGGYRLDINADGIKIYSNTREGIFYGIQTFRQLISKHDSIQYLQMTSIVDNPMFEYRGFNLDLCRHFYSVDELKHLIDVMASLKMNKLSLELSDDMGWRIEIKKYPLLTDIGSWRESIGFNENQRLGINTTEQKKYGGFYTQEQMRSIIHYARSRYINIIPQFELTNHIGAAALAYPNLVCNQDELNIDMTNNRKFTTACIGKEQNLEFWENVIDEVVQIFPSQHIHIGSGYINYKECQICDSCSNKIHKNHLKNYDELEKIYLRNIEEYIYKKGKKAIAWNNTWDFSNNKSTTSMIWRGEATADMNIQNGHKFILMPKAFYCFNNAQSVNDVTKSDKADITLKDSYLFSPHFSHFNKKERELFYGVSGCLWTNNSPDFNFACYRIFPRLLVVAEKGWYGYDHINWEDFQNRTNRFKKILKHYHITYGQPSSVPSFHLTKNIQDGSILINIENETHSPIYYTTDGSEPTTKSNIFNTPIRVTNETTVKALGVRNDESLTDIITKKFYSHKALMADVKYKYPYLSTVGSNKHTLVNGLLNDYQHFVRENAEFTIDLGQSEEIHKITSKWMQDQNKSIYVPYAVDYFISNDGKKFKQVYYETYGLPKVGKNNKEVTPTCFPKGMKARYIKIRAKNIRQNPSWHEKPDRFAELAVSEVIIE